MNVKTKLLALVAALPLFTSCLSDDEGTGQFYGLVGNSDYVYANSALSYVMFGSTGRWTLTQSEGADWCTPGGTEGYAAYYYMPFHFKVNTTGQIRRAQFTIRNQSADNVYTTFTMMQYACRGDGSLGSSPLATAISGDDGSAITMAYDTLCRPTSVVMSKNGAQLHALDISYNANDSTIRVSDGSSTLTGKYDSGYQPETLLSSSDTVAYFDQVGLIGNSSAFSVEWRSRSTGETRIQALRFPEQSPRNGTPDASYTADSIRHYHRYADGTVLREFMAIEYGDVSNMRQSVDVNQLLLGIEECNPYQLVALFSDARCGKVIKTASTENGDRTVETTTNSDGSIKTMTVKDYRGRSVTYTFTYMNVN